MNDGTRALVAFTRKEIMKEIKLKKDHIIMNMRDLAKILYGFGDVFSSIIINPQTEHSIIVNASTLIDLFKEKAKNPFIASLEQTLATLKTKSVELDNHYMFFIRSEYEFMENEAVDGIFTAKMPLRACTDPNFQSNLPILHKIMMMEGQKILYTGKSEEVTDFNVLIAPGWYGDALNSHFMTMPLMMKMVKNNSISDYMTTLNNKKLKKLLKSKSRVKIEQNPDLFYKEFLKSEVFVPVIAMENEESLSDGDTLDLQIGFFDEENGDRNIYLFTDTNELEKAGYQIKSIAVNVMELSMILAQFDIDFNYIVINPYSVDSYKIDFDEFLEKNNF